MKATIFLIAFGSSLLHSPIINAQVIQRSAYHDALAFKRFAASNNNQILLTDGTREALRYYFGNVVDTASKFQQQANLNPYLNKFIPSVSSGSFNDMASLPGVLSSIGGLDVTNIADALAKFLVRRAKQELTIAFFDKFNRLITEHPDMKSVFPNTCLAFTVVGVQIYNYQGYIQTLRESFEKDLSAINTNLPSIISNHPVFFKAQPELAVTLKSGCYIAGELKDNKHPGDVLNDYPSEYLDAVNPNWKGAIQTLQLFSASLRDTAFNTESGNYWVSAKQIKQLVSDKTTFQIYLGLIFQQSKIFNTDSSGIQTPITFKDISLNEILIKIAGNLIPARDFISALSEKTEKLNTLIKEHKKGFNDSLTIEQYSAYFNASVELLKQSSRITHITAFKNSINEDLAESMKDYFDIVQSASNIVVDISRRNYSSAIVNTVHIYDMIVIRKDIIDDSLIIKNRILNNIFKYGSFMAAIVQAKNSDEIQHSIEAFALPQGSSRVKRETPFNVSLNGYVGLFYGHEYIKGIKDKLAFNTYGLTAPIGVSISRGHSLFFVQTGEKGWKEDSGGWSSSLFLSVIDLGAVAAYRINNDSIAQVPTIQLKDIFSPGAFLSIGLPKSPVSFNIGLQVGPNLRKVAGKNAYSDRTYVRFSASVCVDIPVLNLYTKSR